MTRRIMSENPGVLYITMKSAVIGFHGDLHAHGNESEKQELSTVSNLSPPSFLLENWTLLDLLNKTT